MKSVAKNEVGMLVESSLFMKGLLGPKQVGRCCSEGRWCQLWYLGTVTGSGPRWVRIN